MKRNFSLLFILIVLLLQTGCLYAVRYDGIYRGKIVDADSREPIEGAVVLGIWHTVELTPGGGVSYYYDARETLTDKSGEFSIPGQGLRIMSSLEPMSAVIFKAGYAYYGTGVWTTIKEGLYSREQVKWEGDIPIFPLKKLTLEERIKRGEPDYPSQAPKKKIRLMLEEINKDRMEQGLGPVN